MCVSCCVSSFLHVSSGRHPSSCQASFASLIALVCFHLLPPFARLLLLLFLLYYGSFSFSFSFLYNVASSLTLLFLCLFLLPFLSLPSLYYSSSSSYTAAPSHLTLPPLILLIVVLLLLLLVRFKLSLPLLELHLWFIHLLYSPFPLKLYPLIPSIRPLFLPTLSFSA